MKTRATLLVGHADPDSFNHQLAASYARGFSSAGGQVTRFNLGELEFDPILHQGYRKSQELEPDLVRVRTAIEESDQLIWVFPTYWASPPALVRGFFDRLFLPGWGFKFEEGNPFPKGLLAGRRARVIVTMDSPGIWYTLHYRRCLHSSFGTGSLSFCGLRPVKFTSIYNLHSLAEEKRNAWLERVEGIAAKDARTAKPLASLSGQANRQLEAG